MPIAEIEAPDGRIIELEVPEGATEQQIMGFLATQDLSQYQSQTQQETQQEQTQAATDAAQDQQQMAPQPSGGNIVDAVKNAGLEFMAGVNRGALSVADIPADIANAALQLSGSDIQVPTLRGTEFGKQATAGGFVQNPTARQVIGTLGEFAAPAPAVQAIAGKTKQAGEMIEAATDLVSGYSPAVRSSMKGAVSSGFGQDIVNDIAKTNLATKRKINEMTRIVRAGLDSRLTKESMRPGAIAGDALLDEVNHIRSVNQRAGSAINKIANGLAGKPVDVTDATNGFTDSLKSFGVRLVDDGKGGLKANFDETSLAPGDRGPIKEIVRQFSRLSKNGMDAKGAHDMKRIIDRNVTFGKSTTALSNDAERMLKSYRAGLDNALDTTFPRYERANRAYAETIGALDSVQKAAGTSLDLTGPSANEALGTSLRRLMGNVQSRPAMMDSIKEVRSVANRYGGKFDTNIDLLANVANEFDNKLKTGGSTAFMQQVAQGVGPAAIDMATGTPTSTAANIARKMIGKSEPDPKKTLDALEKLLRAK